MKGPCQLTHLCHTTKQNPDAEILNMIRRHDGLSHELDRLDGDDPRWEALSHEGEMLGVEIVFAKVSTPEALAGKRRVVACEMFKEDEMSDPQRGRRAHRRGAPIEPRSAPAGKRPPTEAALPSTASLLAFRQFFNR